jgi:hypothetical protein
MSDKQPLKRFSIGQLSVSLWENEVEDGENKRSFQSVTASKQYYDRKADEWKWQRLTLKPNEVGHMIGLLEKIKEEDGGEPEPEGETPF